MTEEEPNKPITKKDLVEVLGTFADDILLPAIDKLMDAKFDEKFEKSFKENIRPEILKSERAGRDWTDKKINELKADLVLPLKKENEKIEKITDKLGDKKIFNSEDIKEIKSIDVFAKAI